MSEDLLVDGYDYNPHTCMVEVPYNDYWDMKDKCKENKQLHSIIKEVREGIIKYKEILETGAENNVFYIYLDSPIQKLEKFLNELEKVLGSDKE